VFGARLIMQPGFCHLDLTCDGNAEVIIGN